MSRFAWENPFEKPNFDRIEAETKKWENFTAGLTFIHILIDKMRENSKTVYEMMKAKSSLEKRYKQSELDIYNGLIKAKEGKLAGALSFCLAGRNTCPENLRTWILLSEVYDAMGILKLSRKILLCLYEYSTNDIVVAGTPDKDLEPVNLTDQFAFNVAGTYIQEHDYQTAVDYIHIALNYVEDFDPFKSFILAQCYHNLRRYKEAVVILLQIIERNPDDLSALFYLGLEHQFLKKPEKAEFYFKRTLEIQPSHFEARKYLLSLFRNDVGSDEVEKICEKGLKYHPGSPEFLHMLGLHHMNKGFYNEAKEIFEEVLLKRPNDAILLIAHAFSNFQGSNIPVTAIELQKLKDGEDKEEYNTNLKFFNEKIAEIEKSLLKGLNLKPEYPLGLFIQGNIEGIRGNREKAIQLLKKAYKLHPGLRGVGKNKFLKEFLDLGEI